jgi:hypothetical protein
MAADFRDHRKKNLLAHLSGQSGKLFEGKLPEIFGNMNRVEQLGHKLAVSAQLSAISPEFIADC